MGYIYRHIRLDINEVFYIGMSNKTDDYSRAYCVSNRNYLWNRVFNKLNNKQLLIQIIFEDSDLETLKMKETEFILLYGRKIKKTGTLCNLNDGGDGVGYKKPILNKDKIFCKYVINQVLREKKSIRQCCISNNIDICKFNRIYDELYPRDTLQIRKKSLMLVNKQKAKRISEIGKRTSKKTIENIKRCLDLYRNGLKLKEISIILSIHDELVGEIIKENMTSEEFKTLQKNNRSKVQLTWNNIKLKRYSIDMTLIKEYDCIEKLETGFLKSSLISTFRKKKSDNVKYNGFLWTIDYIPEYKQKKVL